MTSILSTISGQFTKSLIFATVIPVILFVVLSVTFVGPLAPHGWQTMLAPLQAMETEWKVLALSVAVVALSGLLYNLNTPVIRLYAGYPWKDSFVGLPRVRYYQRKYRAYHARWRGLRTLTRALDDNAEAEAYNRLSGEMGRIGLRLYHEFPKDPGLVLPTRLGNAIRSFEDYPYRQYGMEGISLWPRLIAKVDKEFAAGIDDAKVSFDFTLNCSFLSALLALMILFAGLFNPTMSADAAMLSYWLVEIAAFALLSFWFYVMSIDRVGNWGALFRSAFDLYRWDLLKQLGYERPPATMAEERFLWRKVYQQFVYGDTPSVPLAEYKRPRVFAMSRLSEGIPGGMPFQTARGVSLPDDDGRVTVTLQVRHVNKFNPVAKAVVVSDSLPEGFDYEWGSVSRVDGTHNVEVSGGDPIFFQIGDIDFDRSATVRYRVIPTKAK
ncbi:MAG TPA: hypothetical protein VM914_12410 [Pyrinomonadaceae bacterium]|nr:hypothetical protein [Pyrinomonadaceae bacterium]